MARSLGKPVVLVRNVPVSLMPGLGWLAAACDAVIDGGLGVQFARFNPIGITVARATSPVYAGARDPREAPAVKALLDSLTVGANGADAPVRLTGARSWRSLPALYRDHSLFVTASAGQAREQIASGARVIGPIGSGTDAGTVRGQLEATRGGRPAALAEVRVWLRDIFAEHATPARLTEILRVADLPGDLVRGRQIAVLATVSNAAEAGQLASALLNQRLRPAEVIAATRPTAAAAVREALGKLTDHDIRVVVTSFPDDRPGPATAAGGWPGPARWPGWPACPGWRRGPLTTAGKPARTAAGQPGTCSTWPVRGSARRPTRSGSARASTSSRTGWNGRPSSRRPCWRRAVRRPGTGAATGCGCSRSPPNQNFSPNGATPIGRIQTKRAGLR